ncbi:MAG TPA: 2Fe-2S iron-sulfur cluster binding domain-containing protein [Bacillales bacterium]
MTVSVRWLHDGQTYELNEQQTLLHGLLENGVDLAFLCMFGHCGTCMARLVEGEVEHDQVPGLSEVERQAGCILLCSSRPKSRQLVLDLICP